MNRSVSRPAGQGAGPQTTEVERHRVLPASGNSASGPVPPVTADWWRVAAGPMHTRRSTLCHPRAAETPQAMRVQRRERRLETPPARRDRRRKSPYGDTAMFTSLRLRYMSENMNS